MKEYKDPHHPLQQLVRLVWTTSMVPAASVAKYYNKVILGAYDMLDSKRKLTGFLDYFQLTYVGLKRNNSWRLARIKY